MIPKVGGTVAFPVRPNKAAKVFVIASLSRGIDPGGVFWLSPWESYPQPDGTNKAKQVAAIAMEYSETPLY